MIGIVVTGHGNFATGLISGFKVITGKPNNMIAVDYLLEDSVDILEQHIKKAVSDLQESCEDGIIIFCDIADGAPYKVAKEFANNDDKVFVIGGVNLAMLTETSLARGFMSEVDTLSDMAINTGKDQVILYDKNN